MYELKNKCCVWRIVYREDPMDLAQSTTQSHGYSIEENFPYDFPDVMRLIVAGEAHERLDRLDVDEEWSYKYDNHRRASNVCKCTGTQNRRLSQHS